MKKKRVFSKQGLSLLVTALLFCFFVSADLQAREYGDVNNDGNINIVDGLMTAQYAVGLNPQGFSPEFGDADGDSNITIIDALIIAQYAVGLIDHIPGPQTTASPSPTPGTSFVIGFDGSEARGAEAGGVQYKDRNGQTKSPLQIFKDNGYSWIRIRIMVDPEGDYGLFQDLNYVKAMALEAKNRGFKFLLDFHYSHWWADPANQWTPPAWKGMTLSQLEAAVYYYTVDVITQLKDQGTLPDMVQIGNEVNPGMLWELGRTSNWSQFVTLTNAGAYGVKDASGSALMPKIMMHLTNSGDSGEILWWMENFLDNGGWIDCLGLSYYPMWHGSFDDLRGTLASLRDRYSWLDVYLVEVAYYWDTNQEGYSGSAVPYPQTPQGQYDYLKDLRDVVEPEGCKGMFYWGACWTQRDRWLNAPGWSSDASRRSLFDDNARATIGIRGLVD